MAMVILDGPIVEINGKQGNTSWRADQCGQHAQALTWKRTYSSEKQHLVNCAFLRCIRAWKYNFADAAQRQTWWWYSITHTHTNKKGQVIQLTAYSWFLKINLPRVLAGLPILLTAPGY